LDAPPSGIEPLDLKLQAEKTVFEKRLKEKSRLVAGSSEVRGAGII